MPRFSVVVPTRDRPDLLDFCLESLAAQTFDDVEVVVCDNPAERPARAVFDRWARSGWRYVTPDRSLPMHENFEFGCSEAAGEYVAMVIDKTVLQPSALEVVNRALSAEPTVDLVSWRNDGYDPVDEARGLGPGYFEPLASPVPPALFDAAAELRQRFANQVRRGVDPVNYVRGKIVFGAYSRTLLRRIRAVTGRVFHPLAPDYTSMVPACVLSSAALDVGRPLLVSYNSVRSNGRLQSIDPSHARRFVEAADPAIIDALPVPGIYASHHNLVAYDLASAAGRCPPGTAPQLDLANLVRRIREDLDVVTWSDPNERAAQYALLEAAEARTGVVPAPPPAPAPPERRSVGDALAAAAARVPGVMRIAGRANDSRPTYDSPVEAARAAERHYAAALA